MGEKLGSVRISPHVLATIARLTTLSVPGVVRMYRDVSSGFDRWLHGRGGGNGVHVQVIDDAVAVDLYVVAEQHVNLYEVGREIQSSVSRAIKDMVGMPVLHVDVHIEEVEYTPSEE